MDVNQEQQSAGASAAVIKIGKLAISKKTAIISAAAFGLIVVAGVVYALAFSSEWVAKINGEKITLDEFNNLYYAQQRTMYDAKNEEIDKFAKDPSMVMQNPMLSKNEFLSKLTDSIILYQEAKKAGYEKKSEVKALLELRRYEFTMRYYVLRMFKDKIKVSDEEVAAVYEQNKAKVGNAKLEDIKEQIRSDVARQKIQMEQSKKIQELRDSTTIDRTDLIDKISDPDVSKRPKTGKLLTVKGSNISTKSFTVDDFNNLYYTQMKETYMTDAAGVDKIASDPVQLQNNPALNKKSYLDQLVYGYIVSEAARATGFTKDTDYISLMEFMRMQTMVSYYLRDKYMPQIEVTQAEIADEYNKNKSKMAPNLTHDQAENLIKQELIQMKLNQKLTDVVPQLRDKAVKEKNQKLLDLWSK